MLIRSQDKERIMNFTGASVGIDQEMSNDNNICIAIFYFENAYEELGEYSTKAKAMKVLDMIQEAYADEKLVDYTKYLQLKEIEKMDDSTILALRNELMKKAVFQMPEDSEVEV